MVIDFVIYVGTNGLSPIYVKIQKIRNSFDNDNNKKMIALTVISNVVQFANVCVLFVEVTMNVNAFSGSNKLEDMKCGHIWEESCNNCFDKGVCCFLITLPFRIFLVAFVFGVLLPGVIIGALIYTFLLIASGIIIGIVAFPFVLSTLKIKLTNNQIILAIVFLPLTLIAFAWLGIRLMFNP